MKPFCILLVLWIVSAHPAQAFEFPPLPPDADELPLGDYLDAAAEVMGYAFTVEAVAHHSNDQGPLNGALIKAQMIPPIHSPPSERKRPQFNFDCAAA